MNRLSCIVKKHDRHHIELKTNLPIPETGKGRYEMSFYLYSPAQLQVDRQHLSAQKILYHVQTYTRYTSPAISLQALVDPACEQSPLSRIKQMLDEIDAGNQILQESIIYELQTLTNAFRSEVKGYYELLSRINESEYEIHESVAKQSRDILLQIEDVLKELRRLFPRFLNVRINDASRKALNWTDEALGLIAIKHAIKMYAFCEKKEELAEILPAIEAFVEEENGYRIRHAYKSAFYEKDHEGERIAYRESMLKKWSQSAMYMRSSESKLPRNITHILAAVAAGTAMLFAVLAAIYAERFFVKNSMAWAVVIILAYVFKDRIKDILKEIFSRILPRMLADRIDRLIDGASGKDAARAQLFVSFTTDEELPADIRKLRGTEQNPFFSILPHQNVLRYTRLISLKSAILRSCHTRLEALTEITRIRIDDWLKEMDDPEEIHYRLEKGKRKRVKGNRVYHLHLIVSVREDRKRTIPELFHYCVVANRHGIIRIEER